MPRNPPQKEATDRLRSRAIVLLVLLTVAALVAMTAIVVGVARLLPHLVELLSESDDG